VIARLSQEEAARAAMNESKGREKEGEAETVSIVVEGTGETPNDDLDEQPKVFFPSPYIFRKECKTFRTITDEKKIG
jgi:hypothetical protein